MRDIMESKKYLKTAALIIAGILMVIGFSRVLELLYALLFSWIF